ncbi:RICIN domain-containing protein [Amycolatopsis sp. NPDC058986]|uniref:RICIN domain-containing protein n=1 Tax=unclassified Amycolatopsis TaxID=2618356 RepID=UPI00366DDC02
MRIRSAREIAILGVGRHVATGLLALAIFATALGAPTAVAAPAPTPAAASAQTLLEESTTDEKFKAAAVLGISAREDMLVLNDKNFVLALWRKAKEGSEVKNAALLAFTSSDDYACTRFIKTGIYTAKQIDDNKEIADYLAKEKARAAKRNAVAQVPGMEATDEVINLSDKEFVFRVWQKAKDGSAVKNAAADALRPESTPEDHQKFINKGIYDAREIDRQKEIADAKEAERKAKELKEAQEAKALAVSAALGIVADEAMKNLPDRDFVDMIWTKTTGAEVKIAARAALDAGTPAALKEFIATGVHAAHQRDIEARDAKDAELKTRQVKEILDAAERDGFQPHLVAAARTALKTPTLAVLTAFLNKGQHDAAKLDLAKPAEGLVIELKGLQSGRCLQVAGLWGQGAENNGAGTELWDCVNGNKQRWVLRAKGNDRYALQNVNSLKCLGVAGGGVNNNDALVQNDCAGTAPEQLWEFVPVGDDGMMELRNVKSGKAAAAANGGTDNATLVVQYTNTHASNQAWRLIDVNHTGQTIAMQPGVIELKGVQSQRCLQVAGGTEDALTDGRGTELWDCVSGGKQRWELLDLGSHKYALRNVNSRKCLDVTGLQARNGVALTQYACHLDVNQQWTFVTGKNGAVKLQSVFSGGVASVLDSGTHNGALVQQFADSNGDEQQWLVTTLPTQA